MTIDQTMTQLRPVLRDLAAVAGSITDAQVGAPTPCSEYDVAQLTNHTVAWLENFAGGYASDDGTCPSPDPSDQVVPRAEAADRITAAASVIDRAIAAGAGDRELRIGAEAMPGDMSLSMILAEYLIHGWDLATATGQAWKPDDATVTGAHEFLKGMVTPEARGGSWFGDEVDVADDASPLAKLVAFAGRRPDWTAP